MTVKKNKICVGVIADAHGVRGLVKVRSFTEEPCDILAYGTLYDEAFSREFVLEKLSVNKDVILAKLVGVADRDKALELKGKKLYVDGDEVEYEFKDKDTLVIKGDEGLSMELTKK